MSESLGLTSHRSSCNCTGCGMLRAGLSNNCAEKTVALILESGPGDLAVEPCSGACREAQGQRPRSGRGRKGRGHGERGTPTFPTGTRARALWGLT